MNFHDFLNDKKDHYLLAMTSHLYKRTIKIKKKKPLPIGNDLAPGDVLLSQGETPNYHRR